MGPNGGVATFYPYLPDLSIAQVMFIAGVAVTLLGTLALVGGSRAVRAAAAGVTAAGQPRPPPRSCSPAPPPWTRTA